MKKRRRYIIGMTAVLLGGLALITASVAWSHFCAELPFVRSWENPNDVYVVWSKLTPENVNDRLLLSSETWRYSYTPLQQAVVDENVEAVKLCLQLGADVEKRVDSMHYVQVLRKNGKSVFYDVPSYTPLHLAVLKGNAEIVTLLLDAGADVECRFYSEGWSPLMLAAVLGNEDMLRLLLSRGANPHAVTEPPYCLEKCDCGKTPLDIATAAGHASCADLLRSPRAL
jgi:ankyrin repeat protein